MREILFRGKHFDTGEWIEGLPARQPDGVIREIERLNFEKLTNGVATIEYIEVKEETVCQYTGLTDKNGRKIFEGDILNVIYSDRAGECHHAENYVLNDLRNTSVIGWLDYANELEVVGNIFDNIELLNGD